MLRIVARESRARARDPAQVALHERDAGALDRDVGAGAHRDADVGLRERGRVVDAVARHRHDVAAAPAARARPRALCSGSTSAMTSSMPSRARHRLRGRAVVAGQHHDAQPVGAQRAQRLGRRRLDRIGDGEHARRRARRRATNTTVCPSRAHRLRGARRAAPASTPSSSSSARVAERDARGRPTVPTHAAPGARLELARPLEREAALARAAATIAAASGCSLAALEAAASRKSSASSNPAAGTIADQARAALGQRAGLVDDQRVDLAQRSSASASLEQHARAPRRGPSRP